MHKMNTSFFFADDETGEIGFAIQSLVLRRL